METLKPDDKQQVEARRVSHLVMLDYSKHFYMRVCDLRMVLNACKCLGGIHGSLMQIQMEE